MEESEQQEEEVKTEETVAAEPTELEKAQAEAAALKDALARTMADFDNYRKRQLRDREQMVKIAGESILKDLIPVADHLEVALEKAPQSEESAAFVEGIRMVGAQFLDILSRHGMEPIDAASGKFDPNFHEALAQAPSAEIPEGEIVQQFRRGWKLGEKILRAAQVVVSSGAPQTQAQESEEA